ncbi:thioredoxin-like protein [Thelonectria olida]|uniref:Thioredoxin-like protein n=1 Tax=Thelonectria olida TaxID=1576542 RepID=A0A9P8WH53_9HYPO|nr:thioredoxin-like protein [Thelonectria olida]
MFESQVTFTLDTTCPWLDKALAEIDSPEVSFVLHFASFQPSPDFPETIPDRSARALEHKHNNKPEAQQLYQAYMRSLAEPLDAPLNFVGPTGNTFPAHRILQLVQDSHGADVANRLVDALFRLFFLDGQHPASDESLVAACVGAGVSEDEAKALVADRERGARQVKAQIRTVGMDVDAVPTTVIEGKRRDLTLVGLKEVAEYVKALQTIIKEST